MFHDVNVTDLWKSSDIKPKWVYKYLNKIANNVTQEGALLFTEKKKIETTYFWKCAPNEDSDQPAHSRSLIRNFTARIRDSQGCKVANADNEDSDQTARIRRLIWVFVGRAYQKVSHCSS